MTESLQGDGQIGGVSEQTIGLALAISSSIFIGSSFIVKKRGLRLAGATGIRAGALSAAFRLRTIHESGEQGFLWTCMCGPL